MMKRTIIEIDRDLCDGCGECITGCHEGALQLVDGKATLVSDVYCDGLGACIGDCPLGAIKLVEREADAFDEEAVAVHLSGLNKKSGGACPGSASFSFARPVPMSHSLPSEGQSCCSTGSASSASVPTSGSELRQWPVQLALVNPLAPWLRDADLLLAADCAAFASGRFHGELLRGRVLAIACPKLDGRREEYIEKLTAMIDLGRIRSFTVVTMTVPCCTGLYQMAAAALSGASRNIPFNRMVMELDGSIRE